VPLPRARNLEAPSEEALKLLQGRNRHVYTSLSPGAIGVRLSFVESATLARRYGFRGIQIDVGVVEKEGAGKVRDLLDSLGLRAGSFGLPLAFREREEAYRESLAKLKARAQAARQVGCTRSSTYILSWSETMDFKENFAFHRDRLRPAAQILADQGILLGLEFLGPKTLRAGKPYPFIHSIEGMLELCEAIGTGNVGLLLDAWHWYTSGAGEKELMALTASQVVDVHVNDAPEGIPIDEQVDNVRCLPGETGVIDIQGFLGRLKAIGYDGPVTPEPFSARVNALPPEEAVKETAEAMKKVWLAAGLAW